MRFFRFSAYYADELDKTGLNSCFKNKKLLRNLSQERITSEFNKILLSENMQILFSMQKNEILEEINISEINLKKMNDLIIFINKSKNKIENNLDCKNILNNKLELFYSMLFSEINKQQQNQLSKMRLANNFVKKIEKIIWFDEEIKNKSDKNNTTL